MCKLIIVFNAENKKNAKVFIEAQRDQMKTERDGLSSLYYDKKDVTVKKSLTNYDEIINDAINAVDKNSIVSLHSRTATQGGITLDNTHFFRIDSYYMAHNGFVPKYYSKDTREFGFSYNDKYYKEMHHLRNAIDGCGYCASAPNGFCKRHKSASYRYLELESRLLLQPSTKTATTEDKTDSFLFLQNIKKPLSTEILQTEVHKTQFTGLGFIVDEKTKKCWLLCYKSAYILTGNGFMAVSSFEPEEEYTETKTNTTAGLTWMDEAITKKAFKTQKQICHGVFQLQYD